MKNFSNGGGRSGGDRPRFGGGGFGGGKPSFNRGGGFGGNRDSRPTQMHPAVCSTCGNACEVPFRPTGDKPVFCNNCFHREDQGSNTRSFDRTPNNRTPRESFIEKGPAFKPAPQMEELKKLIWSMNVKLDKLIAATNNPLEDKMENTETEVEEMAAPVKKVKAKKTEEVAEAPKKKAVKKVKKD